ncbi:MAG: hypothetical protein ACI9X4_002486 [Glaciecola sp.]|jgi:hypothetical protein
MSRAQAWGLHVSNLLVGGTGLIYGYMRYFQVSEDPFSIVNHPLQPDLQHVHILLAPLLVFACGWIWQNHVWNRIRSGYAIHRKSGMSLIATLFPMIFSGYLVQISEQEGWRLIWAWVHGITSCIWLLFAVIHPLLPRKAAPA